MSNSKLEKPTLPEKIASNLGTNIAATLLAAFSGNPVSSLLPILTSTLASGRHKKRVEKALSEISQVLDNYSDRLQAISDEQYKLINETVLTIFQTTEQAKLVYLKKVIDNSLSENDIKPHEAVLLSRIIRDASADEMQFLIDNFRYKYIEIGGKYKRDDTLFLDETSKEALISNGLFGLGVLSTTGQLMDSENRLAFSKISAKLITLLQTKGT